MDSFVNLAKQGLQAYERSQSDVSKTGGQEYNSPHHSQGGYSGAGGPEIDENEVVNKASTEHEQSLFSNALGFLKQNKDEHVRPVDEEGVQNAYKTAYHGNPEEAKALPASSLGSAAALKVLQQFTSGGGSGGKSQTDLISVAMAEASSLFDQHGGGSQGSKQDAVNGAAMTVMKLLVQSKFGGGIIGGGNSGGLGSLMGLASKFL
ncbi:hypothetical protein DICSQDRAFT_131128 [Dichomitus squalens LYAD-421 SS1]|uniref:uncharacterized protein n=1 Tax=Dichomitus squalens (strain LYAD-421) TaxID=732165 RepID=UPI0004412988|nr:uncharacterized protein DICSQDRAFT_131128 [Dichomitus squalens LYAD-421 SS1]EJF66853.1 hypothetical protein DICSQDRAFT_131128 [Dichomitus squalens LYAD-421 SS1]